jgi:hypothetical protein
VDDEFRYKSNFYELLENDIEIRFSDALKSFATPEQLFYHLQN